MAMLSMGFSETSLNTIAFLCFNTVMGFSQTGCACGCELEHSAFSIEGRE